MTPAAPPTSPSALSPQPASAGGRSVVITGVGLISPLGYGAWSTFRALLGGATVADRLDNLEPDTDPTPLAQAVGGVSCARHSATDPAVELAERALREAANEAGADPAGLPTWMGTSKGAVATLTHAAAQHHGTGTVSPEAAAAGVLGPHGYLSHKLAQRTGINVQSHIVAACASGLVALHNARLALQQPGGPARGLVVSCESALLPNFVASYRRLGVLAPTTRDGYTARPLDTARNGFVLGEVGVAVMLEALPPHTAPGPGHTQLLHTAVATDPGDMIRSDPAMTELRRVADALSAHAPGPFAALHPHAPGTANHDAAELALLNQTLGDPQHRPSVYAVKGALGHSLGASGLVSLVCAALCARTRKRPPMPWLHNALAAPGLDLTPHATALAPGPHAVFAAGLGGPVAGASLQRVTD